MNQFIDFEFLEGDIPVKILGMNIPKWLIKPNNTIQPISVGLVSDDNREYYAISKEFNLKEAWNRYDEKINVNYNTSQEASHYNPMFIKEYWIRENVLKPIYDELFIKWCKDNNSLTGDEFVYFNYTNFKELINKYGKTNKQIAEDILWFCAAEKSIFETDGLGQEVRNRLEDNPVKFYGYYSAYDHVCLSWLYGKMIDLPVGFPMYMRDIQQIIDDNEIDKSLLLKEIPQTNCHNALQDAIWSKNTYNWIINEIKNKNNR